jgi:hypothetical protein
MNTATRIGLLFACLAGAACSATAEDESAALNGSESQPGELQVLGEANTVAPATPGPEEVLAEIEAGEETLTFLRQGEGEDATLLLRVQGSIASGSVYQGLLDREGDLTLLEVFQALAPGRVPPEALVEAHPLEAAAMNRTDMGVRSVEKVLPPPGVNVCDVGLIFTPGPVSAWKNQLLGAVASGGNAYVCVSNADAGSIQFSSGQPSSSTCTFSSKAKMTAGFCNNGSKTISMQSGSGTSSVASWTLGSTSNLPAGQYNAYIISASATARRLAAIGFATFGDGSSYGVRSGTRP